MGKQLWQNAKLKVDMYHAATHELQHRAQEKVGFAVAETALTRVATKVAHYVTTPAVVQTAAMAGKRKLWRGVAKYLSRAARALRLPFKAAEDVAPAVVHHAAHPTGLLGACLHTAHVSLPLLGTYLVAHMAHHDLHRAHKEWHTRRAAASTALFYVGFLCDAADALAHALVVACLVLPPLYAPAGDYLTHHLEHELHALSLWCALVACVAMMAGEALAAQQPHATSHAPPPPAQPALKLDLPQLEKQLRAADAASKAKVE